MTSNDIVVKRIILIEIDRTPTWSLVLEIEQRSPHTQIQIISAPSPISQKIELVIVLTKLASELKTMFFLLHLFQKVHEFTSKVSHIISNLLKASLSIRLMVNQLAAFLLAALYCYDIEYCIHCIRSAQYFSIDTNLIKELAVFEKLTICRSCNFPLFFKSHLHVLYHSNCIIVQIHT